MTAVLDQISAAIAAELASDTLADFGYEFTAIESGGDWDLPLEADGPPSNPDRLHVDLVAVNDVMTLDSMVAGDGTKDIKHTCAFQVIVRRRITERIESSGRLLFSEVQGLTELVEKIAMHFMCLGLSTLTDAKWVESEVESIRYADSLRENSQFTGIAKITYY